jgi:hypothetical protein
MKVRLQSSSLRFEEEERRELQKQQNQMKTKRNLQHRLDQAYPTTSWLNSHVTHT